MDVAVPRCQEHVLEPPRPLMREMPEASPFPVASLGPILGPAATGINDRVQAPMAICGSAVLAAASLAAQAHADVLLPGITRPRPLSLFLVTVAESGERKSAVDDEALRAVREREKELRADSADERRRFRDRLDAYQKARGEVLRPRAKDQAQDATVAQLQQLGLEPAPPLAPLLTCEEPTFEGLCRALILGQPSMGLFSDEGATFVGGHAMKDDAKLRSAGGLSSFWDGKPVRRVRATEEVTILAGRRVALHLMMQPLVAEALFGDAILRDQGFLTRVLITAPESTAGTRLQRTPRPESDRAIRAYSDRIMALLERLPRMVEGTQNELEPRALPLDASARKTWIGFSDHVERELGSGRGYEAIRGFGNKLAEHAARVAGVLTIVEDPDAEAIPGFQLARAIDLVQHYVTEALRLAESLQGGATLRLAEKLRVWILDRWPEDLVSVPDICQRGPLPIRNASVARSMVNVLIEHGWLLPVEGAAVVAGTKRREVWRKRRRDDG